MRPYCEVCGEHTVWFSIVLGRQVPLCDAHRKAWTELGPMATMIAFAMRVMRAKDRDDNPRDDDLRAPRAEPEAAE